MSELVRRVIEEGAMPEFARQEVHEGMSFRDTHTGQTVRAFEPSVLNGLWRVNDGTLRCLANPAWYEPIAADGNL